MKENRNTLSKVLGRTDILALGLGIIVGWSWAIFATTWLTEAGFWGAILSFLAGSAVIVCVGVLYSELTAALPRAGGEFIYAYRAMGSKSAWIVGWIMAFAYIGVAAWEGIALATALDSILPLSLYIPLWEIAGYTVHLSWALIGMIGAVIMFILNLFSNRPAMLFQVMGTAVIIILALLILLGGITFGNVDNIGEGFVSFDGCLYVFLMVPSMLIGFNIIPVYAEEMNLPPRGIGKMVLVCIIMSIAWYILIIIGLALCAPLEVRMSGMIPAADVFAYAMGDRTFDTIVILGGIFGILTTWNGFFMGATRMLFSMGRAKMLPSIFGKLHPKYRSPWAAIILVGSICIAAPLLGKNALIWFVDLSAFCALFAYCCVCISFILLRIREPELIRPFKIRFGMVVGCFCSIFSVLYLIVAMREAFVGIENSGISLCFVAVWIAFGLLMVFITKLEYSKIDKQEREVLIFGEKLARRNLS